ncbi:MAG: GNAT family N-acetyltransferase [Candidatus Binatia bacterium]
MRITLEDKPDPADVQLIRESLFQFNVSQTGAFDFQELALFLRDDRKAIVGGLVGWTRWKWLHIDNLWLAEPIRNKGYGSDLLAAAEAEAVARGCTLADLDTFSFQALGFYQKRGYEVFGALENIGGQYTKYFLRKVLGQEGAA